MMNSELTARQIADSILELENFARELNRESSSNALKVLRAIDGLRELQESRKAAAEPVAWTDEQELRDVEKDGLGYIFTVNPIVPGADPRRVIRLYAEPPVPVVPEEITADGIIGMHECGFVEGWNACRAAMLQGGQPVSNRDELSSPVIPDGYALVPIVPTEDMVINGFESEPDPHFSDEKVWAEYEALSGCRRAARRAELCWAAMIKAAPKQEGNNG